MDWSSCSLTWRMVILTLREIVSPNEYKLVPKNKIQKKQKNSKLQKNIKYKNHKKIAKSQKILNMKPIYHWWWPAWWIGLSWARNRKKSATSGSPAHMCSSCPRGVRCQAWVLLQERHGCLADSGNWAHRGGALCWGHGFRGKRWEEAELGK